MSGVEMSEVESELARVLHDRALLIDSAPDYRVGAGPEAATVLLRLPRPGVVRRSWVGIGSAAAVAATFAALAAGIWFGMNGPARHEPGTPSVTRCSTQGAARLEAAVRAGVLPAGQVVLGGAADGSALVSVERRGLTSAVDVVDATGRRSRIWRAGPQDRVRAIANPSGGLGGNRAVFVLVPTDAARPVRVVVVARATGVGGELVPDPGYSVSRDPRTAPIVIGDEVSVVETLRTRPSVQRIAQYWADTTRRDPNGSVRTAGVTQLLPVGGNLVTVRSDHGSVIVDFDQPRNRPSTLPPTAHHGYAFVSDGTTLRWLSRSNLLTESWQWAPGDPSPLLRGLAMTRRPVTPAGRFVVGADQVDDSVTGRVLTLPGGLSLVRADGSVATLVRRAGPAVRYARVPVAVVTGC